MLGGLAGAVGFLASGAQVVDYAQNRISLLFFFVGGALIFLPFGIAFDYLRRHGQRGTLPFIAVAFAMVSAGVFVIVATSRSSAQDSSATKAADAGDSMALQRCQKIPDLKGEPSRLRSCSSLALNDSAGDLDSLDVAWGNPGASLDKGADIKWAGSSDGLQANEKGFITIGAKAISYSSCKAQTVWTQSITHFAAADSGQACLMTDQGKVAGLFWNKWDSIKTDWPPDELDMYVIVWSKS